MSVFNKFQLIAYHVPTDKMLPPGKACEVSAASLEDLKDYLGQQADDPELRLRRMIAVAEQALASAKIDAGKSTLKVFMAPEFYFQPWAQGDYNQDHEGKLPPRAYTAAEMSRILGGLRKVFCEQKRWRGWLLVLGSVIWRAPARAYMDAFDTIEDLKDKDTDDAIKVTSLFKADELANAADKSVVLNTAIVVEGGHGMSTFQKANYADFDKIKSAYQPDMKNDAFMSVSTGRGKLKNYLLELRKPDAKSCIIRVGDNLHVGVEVCKDHLVGVLKGAYKDLRKLQGDKTPAIDLQLLTCCGMSLESERLVVDVDRYALRVDGISADINDAHSEIQQVVRVKGDAHEVQRTTQPIERTALKGDLALAVGDLTTYDKDGQERPLSELIPQEIAVFKTLDLPIA